MISTKIRQALLFSPIAIAIAGCGGTPSEESPPTNGDAPTVDVAERLQGFQRGVAVYAWLFQPNLEVYEEDRMQDGDFKLIKELGLDHIRLPIHLDQVLDEDEEDLLSVAGMQEVDVAIQEILVHDLNVIVDLHSTYDGSRFSQRLEEEADFEETYRHFWRNWASHLSDLDPKRVLLEPLNEPVYEEEPSTWLPVQEKLIAAIREGAPEHTIVATAALWSHREQLLAMTPLEDTNLVYNFHYYEPHVFSHQGMGSLDTSGFSFHIAQLRGVPYPATSEALEPYVEAPPSDGAASLLSEYLAEGWDAEKHGDNMRTVRSWADEHEVEVMCDEWGVNLVYAMEGDRLRAVEDIRRALEDNDIPFTVWDYDGILGFVWHGPNDARVFDAPYADALGLSVENASAERYSRALALEALGSCDDGLIDDLEDGDTETILTAGRSGSWYVYHDDLGTTLSPDPLETTAGGVHDSAAAAHIVGHPLSGTYDAYAGMGLQLAAGEPYDASAYAGVAFWAKGRGTIQFGIADAQVVPEGGICTNCWNSFATAIRLSSDWQHYTVLFSGVKQDPAWGEHFAKLDTSKLYQIEWKSTQPDTDFEIWVDDVELVGCDDD